MCKKDNPTGRINCLCLSCRQTLLSRWGRAASVAEKNKFGIAQEAVTPLTVAKEQDFLVTPDSATSLRLQSAWVASTLRRDGKQKDRLPHFSAPESGQPSCLPVAQRSLCGFSSGSG